MTKTSKTKALKSEPRFEEAPFGEFHPILVIDDDRKFSGPLFLENIRKYEGGYQNWMRDNRDLFERGDEQDVESWTLIEHLPQNIQSDIFAGIKTQISTANNEARDHRWMYFRLIVTFYNLRKKLHQRWKAMSGQE